MDPAYVQRTVAFIDIMGFSALVQRSVAEPDFLRKLYGALRLVEHQGRVWAAQYVGGNPEEVKALATPTRTTNSSILNPAGAFH